MHLVCEAVTFASIGAGVNLGLPPRRGFSAELRRDGSIAISCGGVDLAAAGEEVSAIKPRGAARGAAVCENSHPCVTPWDAQYWRPCFRGPTLLCFKGWLILMCAVEESTVQLYVEWPIVRSCVGRLSVLRYVEIPASLSPLSWKENGAAPEGGSR